MGNQVGCPRMELPLVICELGGAVSQGDTSVERVEFTGPTQIQFGTYEGRAQLRQGGTHL